MKINKVTMTIVIETTHIDSIPGLIERLMKDIDDEVICGMNRMEDGDQIRWETKNFEIDI